jgi:uncharacterized RDD family membrane protein YckC
MSDLPPPPPEQPPPPPPPPGPGAPPPGYVAYGAPQAAGTYAGIGARFGAMLIDGIITALFTIPAYVALFAGPTEIEPCSVDDAGEITFGGANNALCEGPTNGTWAIFAVLLVAAVIAGVIYYARLEGGSGQTVGKKAVGIRVADANSGGPIGTGRAVGRYFARFLSSFFLLGYLWALWDGRKQTWHDKLASSVVVKA